VTAPHVSSYRSLLRKTSSSRDLVKGNANLSSRMVENLFWFGRYAVRNHHFSRLLRTAIHCFMEFTSEHRASEWPTIQGLCNWYGLMSIDSEENPLIDAKNATRNLAESELSDELIEALLVSGIFSSESPSLANHVQGFHNLAFNLREVLSNDQWRTINQMAQRFSEVTEADEESTLSEGLLILDETTTSLVTLAGFALDGMTRDQGWRFMSIGRRIERLQFLCTLLSRALKMPLESNLDWVLELTDSIVTYRYRYASQAEWLPMLDLILMDENNPNAMVFQLKGLIKYLAQITANYGSGGESQFIGRLAALRLFDPDVVFRPGNRELIAWLDETYNASIALSDTLSHRFFSYSGQLQELSQHQISQQEIFNF
jgi:uncharacterized alpha-E superfamily protein